MPEEGLRGGGGPRKGQEALEGGENGLVDGQLGGQAGQMSFPILKKRPTAPNPLQILNLWLGP